MQRFSGFLDTWSISSYLILFLILAWRFFEAFRFPMLGEAANDTLFFFWEFRV